MGLAGGYAEWIFSLAAFSALYALLPWFGGEFGLDREAGVIGGLAGSLIALPPANSEEIAGIAIGLLAVIFLRRWITGLGSFGSSILLGVVCGVAYHLQPVLLPVVLGWMVFELWWSQDRRKWRLSGIMVLGMAIACAPWACRNYSVFDEVFFIRSNFGLELRIANHEGAAGAADVMAAREGIRHPRINLEEAQILRELGELEYMRRARAEAIDWIETNPGEFLKLTTSRLTQFWFGPLHQPGTAIAVTTLTILALLGAWRSLPAMTIPQRAALITPLVFYPLVYYIVMYMPRYRIPLDWILLLLAGAAIWHWIRSPSPRIR